MSQELVFDQEQYEALNAAREKVVRRLFSNLGAIFAGGKPSAVDVGCGAGYFSNVLHELGFDVVGVDARTANVEECQKRYPTLNFRVANAEELQLMSQGPFDLVLCFGLLYHLENPFQAIRNLYDVTGKLLIVESMCAPGGQASMELLDEYCAEDQGVNYVAFYPTEACLAKMLYRAGFPFVYSFRALPDDPNYRATPRRRQARTMLAASRESLDVPDLERFEEPTRAWDLWEVPVSSWRGKLGRLTQGIRRRVWLDKQAARGS